MNENPKCVVPTPEQRLESFIAEVNNLNFTNVQKAEIIKAVEELAKNKDLKKFSDETERIVNLHPEVEIDNNVYQFINKVGKFYSP
jgi:hypothetical protein